MEKLKLKKTVKAAQAGDSRAMDMLYREYAKRVYYFALKVMKNKEDAEDIMQEVFVYVLRKIGEVRSPEAFPVWLNRVTASKCTDVLRNQGLLGSIDIVDVTEAEFIEETDSLSIPEESLENIETARIVGEIVDNLPTQQKICLYNYYYQNLKIAEISEILDIKEITVKKHLAAAREKIRKEIEHMKDRDGITIFGAGPLMLAPVFNRLADDFIIPEAVVEAGSSAVTASVTSASVTAATGAGLNVKVLLGAVAGIIIAAGITTLVLFRDSDDINDSYYVDVGIIDDEEAYDTSPVQGNTSNNLANSGTVVIHDGWIYYSPPHVHEFYKMREDGSEKTLLAERNAQYMNIVGDYIYYLESDPGPSAIYKMRFDETTETVIHSEDYAAYNNLTVVGDWIYYTMQSWADAVIGIPGTVEEAAVYRIKTDGTGHERLNNARSNTMHISGEWIYFIELHDSEEEGVLFEQVLCKMRLDGSEYTRFEDDKEVAQILLDGDVIYVVSGFDRLYKMNTDGTDKTEIAIPDMAINLLNIMDEWLFFNEFNINGELRRLNINDGTIYGAFLTEFDKVIIIDEWIYFFVTRFWEEGGEDYTVSLHKTLYDGLGWQNIDSLEQDLSPLELIGGYYINEINNVIIPKFGEGEEDDETFAEYFFGTWQMSKERNRFGGDDIIINDTTHSNHPETYYNGNLVWYGDNVILKAYNYGGVMAVIWININEPNIMYRLLEVLPNGGLAGGFEAVDEIIAGNLGGNYDVVSVYEKVTEE